MKRELLVCLLITVVVGCSGDETATTDNSSIESVAENVSSAESSETPEWAVEEEAGETPEEVIPPSTDTISLKTLDGAGLEALVKENQGKVILVDFWATWCVPCRKSFPHTVELGKSYGDQGLVVITVAFDDEIAERQIKEFLARQESTQLGNFRSAHGSEDLSFSEFEIGETGLPHYKIYDKSGTLLKTFYIDETGQPVDQEELEQTIKTALKS